MMELTFPDYYEHEVMFERQGNDLVILVGDPTGNGGRVDIWDYNLGTCARIERIGLRGGRGWNYQEVEALDSLFESSLYGNYAQQ